MCYDTTVNGVAYGRGEGPDKDSAGEIAAGETYQALIAESQRRLRREF
jgi:hypothetical protein